VAEQTRKALMLRQLTSDFLRKLSSAQIDERMQLHLAQAQTRSQRARATHSLMNFAIARLRKLDANP
jgi:hypothetical protein